MITVGFIGAGNMGYAIMRGVATSGLCDSSNGDKAIKLSAFDVNTQQTERLKEYGVTACAREKDIMESCKYLFLAVKPQMFEGVLKTLSPYSIKTFLFVLFCLPIFIIISSLVVMPLELLIKNYYKAKAKRKLKKINYKYRVVTLDGEILHEYVIKYIEEESNEDISELYPFLGNVSLGLLKNYYVEHKMVDELEELFDFI